MKAGFLVKMGNNVIKDWKRRWVVLKGDSLEYFKNRMVHDLPIVSLYYYSKRNN